VTIKMKWTMLLLGAIHNNNLDYEIDQIPGYNF